MSATEEATQMIVEEAPAKNNSKTETNKSKGSKKEAPKMKKNAKPAAAAENNNNAKEENKKKKKARKADRTNFTTAIRKIAKKVLEGSDVTKAKKGFYDQVNYALIEWLRTVANHAASFSNTRKKAKTITMRDMYTALKASLCIGANFDQSAKGYLNLDEGVEKVGRKRAGPSKADLHKRLVEAYGERYDFTRTRTVKGKEVTTTLINPSRVSSLFLKKTGVERVANGVAHFLAFHAQVLVIEFLTEIANIAEFFKTKTMTQTHIARAYHSGWYARYLFGAAKSSTADIPVVLDPVVLPTKKSLLEAKREGKRKWREAHAELLPYLRKQKRAKKNNAEGPSSSVKKTTSAKKPKTAKKASVSKSRSKSKKANNKKANSKVKSKSQSKSKSVANKKKSASAHKKPKTAASKVKKNAGNGTAAKKVKA